MSNATSQGKRFAGGALAEVFPWLFVVDVFSEVIGEFRQDRGGSVIDNLLYLLALVGLTLTIGPFVLAFVGPAGLAWWKGFGLTASLLVGTSSEGLLLFWIRKKLSRDPKNRAFDRAQKILQGNPQVSFEDLCEKVRKALSAEDKHAIRFADDMASRAWSQHQKTQQAPRRGFRIRFRNPFAGWLDFDGRIKSFSGPKPSTRINFGQRRGKLPGVINKNNFTRNRRRR